MGDVTIGGAKNAALGILAASIMTDEDVLIDNLPDVRDINVMLEAIQEIGARVERVDRHTVKINGSGIKKRCQLMMNISAVSVHLIILSAPCWENIRVPRYHFQVDATLKPADRPAYQRFSVRWEQMYR